MEVKSSSMACSHLISTITLEKMGAKTQKQTCQLGHFQNICMKHTPQNVLHLFLGFIFGVQALYFDIHKVIVI